MLQHSEENAIEDRSIYNKQHSAGQRRLTGKRNYLQVRNKIVL